MKISILVTWPSPFVSRNPETYDTVETVSGDAPLKETITSLKVRGALDIVIQGVSHV